MTWCKNSVQTSWFQPHNHKLNNTNVSRDAAHSDHHYNITMCLGTCLKPMSQTHVQHLCWYHDNTSCYISNLILANNLICCMFLLCLVPSSSSSHTPMPVSAPWPSPIPVHSVLLLTSCACPYSCSCPCGRWNASCSSWTAWSDMGSATCACLSSCASCQGTDCTICADWGSSWHSAACASYCNT